MSEGSHLGASGLGERKREAGALETDSPVPEACTPEQEGGFW